DVTTHQDVDYFSVRAPSGYTGPVTFRVQTAGISLLQPRLRVYNASGQLLGAAESSAVGGDTLTVQLDHVTPGAFYYARVEGASNGLFGIGRYGLAVTLDDRVTVDPTTVDAVLRGPYTRATPRDLLNLFRDPNALVNDDGHTDETFSTATQLRATP